jgi:type IV pilus assembly protein PilQ
MRINVWVAVATIALASGAASAAEVNALSGIEVKSTGSGAQVILIGSRSPTFTVFRLGSPDRLVVDLSAADVTRIKGHHAGGGPVAGVVASQFADERARVGRVIVALGEASTYNVRADGSRLVISVDAATARKSGPASTPASTAVATSPAPTLEGAPKIGAVTARESDRTAAAATAPRAGRENVVNSTVDERKVRNPARKIVGMQLSRGEFRVRTDGDVRKFEVIELSDPPRLALDVYGVSLAARAPKGGSGEIEHVRVGAHSEKVRVVIDVVGAMPAYEARRVSQGIALEIGSSVAARKASPAARGTPPDAMAEIDGKRVDLGETEPLAVTPAPPAAGKKVVELKELTFRDDSAGGRIDIKFSGEIGWKVERPDPRSAVLTLEPARVPKHLERSLDTSALQTPVKTISTFGVPGGQNRVRVVVASSDPLEDTLIKTAAGLAWRLSAKGVKTEQVAVAQQTAPVSGESPAYSEQGAPRQSRYRGKRVTFEFKDIDIHNLLRVIAEVSKKNIVVADDVKGTVTIRLRNVPWDQALELILRSKGLGKEELGNIVRVAPLATLEAEAKLREERKKSLMRQEELVVRLIPVNYATADDMKSRVKEVLSERGTVTVDTRTNVLIVRDIASGVNKAQSLVRNLDTQTPQVLIESRIVEASTSFSRQIGVQWGGHAQFAPATGNPTGLVFPYTAAMAGGSTASSNAGTAEVPEFAVNLPAAVGTGSGGALGFIFGSAGGAVALNLRISALENQGTVKTISAPKVTTLDNNTAKISQGVSIPFSQVSASGVNTTFVEARLSLEVTPHITQDGSILMAIKAENNQPDPSSTGANGQPAIQRKEANTQVLVKDGDTTVIGGIYVRRGATQENGVPFLKHIPILGFFFKNHSEVDSRQELLIFITPRIINRQTIAQTL